MKNLDKIIHSRSVFHRMLLWIYVRIENAELPKAGNIGKNVHFPHGLKGVVINPNTIIEDNVTIFHQVTCGRGDLYNIFSSIKESTFGGIVLKEGCVLCAGAKIICNRGVLTVGKNTIVAAGAVLTQSTGDNEIWAGVPARLIRKHDFSH